MRGARSHNLKNIDLDEVTSFGPEIVSIRRPAQGTYRYFLTNFSGTSARA